jgi:hypothetical protein
MKKKAPEQQLCDAAKRIRQEINHWHYINKIGCQDPFWPDGCNMNLVRNHIISYKLEIQQICEESGFALPEEYYLPTPPEVDNDYMANQKQKERVKRLIQQGHHLTRKKVKYDECQLSIF